MPLQEIDIQTDYPAAAATDRQTAPVRPIPPGSPIMKNIEISVFDSMAPLEAEWRRLQANPLSSLHQGYDWCAAWVDTHREPLAIIRGSAGGELLFILPLEIVRSNMVRIAQFIGGRFSNINTGLFSPAFDPYADNDAMTALVARITEKLTGKADMVSLQNIPFLWRDAPHPLARLPAIENQNHAFQLPLLSSFEATIAQINAKRRRKKFRNQSRKLEALGGFDHVVATTTDEKSAMLDLFFRQKATRFKALGLPNVFQAAETQAFFHALVQIDNDGRDVPLQLNAIRLKGEFEGSIVAIAGLSRKGDHVICQFGSIDETLAADASPGELLFWLMIERSCAEGAALFDFGIGDQCYKRSWCTQETVHYDILLPVSALGRLAVIAQRGVTRTKAAIKSNPQLYALLQRLRASSDPEPATESDAA